MLLLFPVCTASLSSFTISLSVRASTGNFIDPELFKAVQLAQLSAQYIAHSHRALRSRIASLEETLAQTQADLKEAGERRRDRDRQIRRMRKENHSVDALIESYQIMLAALNPELAARVYVRQGELRLRRKRTRHERVVLAEKQTQANTTGGRPPAAVPASTGVGADDAAGMEPGEERRPAAPFPVPSGPPPLSALSHPPPGSAAPTPASASATASASAAATEPAGASLRRHAAGAPTGPRSLSPVGAGAAAGVAAGSGGGGGRGGRAGSRGAVGTSTTSLRSSWGSLAPPGVSPVDGLVTEEHDSDVVADVSTRSGGRV